MTKRKKVATAAAGTVLAAALAVSSVGGPTTNNVNDGSFAGSITAIEEAVDNLVDKSVERGMDIEPPSESYTPGINGVIEGLNGMSPAAGTTRTVKVSKEGTLYRGDRLRQCMEFTAGEQLRFATGDVKIITTAQFGTVGQTRIAVLFTQSGQTKLKTIDISDEMAMGNTVVILEDEALTTASMVIVNNSRCYIAYNRGGDGVMTAVKCGDNRLNELLWSDLWMDGGDPENICLAVEPYYEEAAVCCTRLPQGSTNDTEREAVLLDMSLPTGGSEISGPIGEILLTAQAQPALYGIDYSKDSYAKGWGMEYVHYWYEEPDSEELCNSLLITYPTSNEYRRGIIHVRRDRSAENQEEPAGPSKVMGYQVSQVYGSLPCVEMQRVHTGNDMVAVAVIHGVTKQFGEDGAGTTKSRAEMELYTVARDTDKPCLLWWRATDNWYNTNISNVSTGHLRDGVLYLAFARGTEVYAALVELRKGDSVQGPVVKVGAFGTFAAVETVNSNKAALIYDTAAGDGYLRILQSAIVVAETDGYHFDGTALESGGVGETIRADMAN